MNINVGNGKAILAHGLHGYLRYSRIQGNGFVSLLERME